MSPNRRSRVGASIADMAEPRGKTPVLTIAIAPSTAMPVRSMVSPGMPPIAMPQ
jgi:hypothetical protein